MKAGAKDASEVSAASERRARAATRPARVAKPTEPRTFLDASLHDGPVVLSAPETERMWEIQRSAERDPDAFIAASRAKARR